MRRRDFIRIVSGFAAGWPRAALAQKTPVRLGFMASGTPTSATSAGQIDAISQGLRANGLMPGQDYLLEARFAAGDYRRFPQMARELAQAGVRVMLAGTVAAGRAAQDLMPPVPVVMLATNDPVGSGMVASLARPGGVTTGLATLNQDLTPKLLEVQAELIPNCQTMAVLFNPANPSNPLYVEKLRVAASPSGISLARPSN
jgi:putative ABC transport system substrate-binding protein